MERPGAFKQARRRRGLKWVAGGKSFEKVGAPRPGDPVAGYIIYTYTRMRRRFAPRTLILHAVHMFALGAILYVS